MEACPGLLETQDAKMGFYECLLPPIRAHMAYVTPSLQDGDMQGTFQELLVFAAEAEKKVRAARLAEGTYTPLQGAQPAQVMLISNGPVTTPKGKLQVFPPGLEAFESLLDKRIWAEQSLLDTNGIVLLTQALPDDDKVDALTPASVPMDVNALSIPQQQLV